MEKFNRPYVRDQSQFFAPTYLQGENYSFYMNLDVTWTDTYISSKLYVIKQDGTKVAFIGLLPYILTAGAWGYEQYISDFVFPRIPDGYYFFQIWNADIGIEMARSNVIIVNSHCLNTTTPVKFRHNDKLYGYRYDLLPDFYNKFRLPINQINAPEVKSEREQYRQSANGRDLRNSKSFRDIVIKLEFYWADDADFKALSAMLEHDEIYISGNRIMDMSQVKIDKVSEFSELSKGSFDVIVNDYNVNNRELEHYGSFILWGGNSSNILNTFARG